MLLKYFNRLRHHIRDFVDYLQAFWRKEYTNLHVARVESPDYLLAAKKLHAEVYLYRNFVTKKDIRAGVLNSKVDPYQPHSQYFVVTDKSRARVLATARQIQAKPKKGHDSFAMLTHTRLYERSREQILAHAPVDCVEISGLAKHRGVSKLAPLLLYRAMLQHSLRNHHKLWLLACDVRLYVRLKLLFGSAIQQAGPRTFYLGSEVVPAILRLDSAIQSMHKSLRKGNFFEKQLRYRVLRFILKDVPTELLSPKEKKAFDAIMHFR